VAPHPGDRYRRDAVRHPEVGIVEHAVDLRGPGAFPKALEPGDHHLSARFVAVFAVVPDPRLDPVDRRLAVDQVHGGAQNPEARRRRFHVHQFLSSLT